MHPYLQVEGPVVMAHRGFSLDGLENTMPAFGAAVGLGVTHVETDVHATADGALVAFHDASLDRVTDATGLIADLDWATVSRAQVIGARSSAGVPLLADVLASWPDLRVNIDVKDWPAIGPLVDVVRRASALHRVCVTSFDDRRTAAVRRALGPGLATSPGRRGVSRWRLGSLLPGRAGEVAARLPGRSAVALQVPMSAGPLTVVTPRSIDLAHRQGLAVHVWTVNDAPTMRRLLDLGVDGLITDRADLAVEVTRAALRGRA
ncbi:MAG: glycerophosphodiester phosphodiesterase [Actinomycetota bacterium]